MNREIEKKILNKDVSDYSKKNILARTEQEQSIFLAHLMWYRDSCKEKESKEEESLAKNPKANPHLRVIYSNQAYFCEQQISKIKRWLSDEDFKFVEKIAQPEIVKLIKADKLTSKLAPIIVLIGLAIVIFLITVSFSSILNFFYKL